MEINNKRKVILDVDTGTDDAIAIMIALLSDDLDVLGVTSVNGNRGIDYTTENTLRVVEYLNSNVKVYKGCGLPIVSTLHKGRRDNVPYQGPEDPNERVHDDYLNLPPATIKEEDQNAVSWIVETLMKTEDKVTIIPVGPLTNIGLALRVEPRIKEKIEEIIIMGGGYKENNITPAAEFNFWIDPEAAKIVINSGCKITLVPLDATHAAAVSTKVIDELAKLGTKASIAASKIIEERLIGYNNWQPMEDTNTVPVHDALAVCAAINREVLKDVRFVNVDVDISGGICDGQSVCDVESKDKNNLPNVNLAISADPSIFAQMLKDILGKK